MVHTASEALRMGFADLEFHPYREGLIRQGLAIAQWQRESQEAAQKKAKASRGRKG